MASVYAWLAHRNPGERIARRGNAGRAWLLLVQPLVTLALVIGCERWTDAHHGWCIWPIALAVSSGPALAIEIRHNHGLPKPR